MRDAATVTKYAIGSIATCSDGSCVSNVVQLAISGIIILWLLYELAMNIRLHRNLAFNWQEIMLLQILLCLIFNVCFSIWSSNIIWYLLSSLFFAIYFTTLVYYFTLKYLDKKIKPEKKKPFMIMLVIAYIGMCLGDIACFVYLIAQEQIECKKLGSIVLDGIMIFLGVIFFFLTYSNEHEELSKFKQYKAVKASTNPLKVVWIWVCCNIVGQITNQIQNSLIYRYYKQTSCQPISGNLQTDILAPLFLILTYGISFCSTLWFYNRRRRVQEQSQSLPYSNLELTSAQVDIQNRVQLLPDSNPTSSRTTLSFPQNYLS